MFKNGTILLKLGTHCTRLHLDSTAGVHAQRFFGAYEEGEICFHLYLPVQEAIKPNQN